jgi:hypothetical protein
MLSLMRSKSLLGPAAVIAVTTLVFACGSSSSSGFDESSSGSSGASSGASGSSGGFGSSGSSGSSGGTSGTDSCAATVAQPQKAKVDIIFVIDDSGSMTEEMNQIKTNVNTFAQKIGGTGLDYRVIFIVKRATSSTQTGNVICVPPPLGGTNCADNPPLFWHIPQDVQSTNSLSLILSTYDSANATLQWKQHLRMDATKVFVEVTDDKSALAYTSFDTQLLAKAPAGMFGTAAARNYIFHSICSKPFADAIPSNNICSTAAGTSVDYQQLSKLTGGIVDEVCKTDYSGVLDNIAKGIVDKLGCQLTYPTADAADPTKLVVTFTPAGQAAQNLTQVTDPSKCATIPNGWYYDDNNAPTKIILCPTMCTTANSSAGSKIEALVGCKAPAPS